MEFRGQPERPDLLVPVRFEGFFLALQSVAQGAPGVLGLTPRPPPVLLRQREAQELGDAPT